MRKIITRNFVLFSIGFIVFLIVFAASTSRYSQARVLTVRGVIGSEKMNLLLDTRVQEILLEDYNLIMEIVPAGSVNMVTDPVYHDMDFIWPGSQFSEELFRSVYKMPFYSALTFSSPLVLYSWEPILSGLYPLLELQKLSGSSYTLDLASLLPLLTEKHSWEALGFPEIYGDFLIQSSNPLSSNSGNIFAAMLANLHHGGIIDEQAVYEVLPFLREYFSSQGSMQRSSGFLFEQFTELGMVAYPFIAGYENQLIEYALSNPERWELVRQDMRMIYPVPTVWSTHPIIALTDEGIRLTQAFENKEIQSIAWEQHGFRTGLIGYENDVDILTQIHLVPYMSQVVPMPSYEVMYILTKELGLKLPD